MKVLVIGSGGREHALTWKIAQSPLVKTVYCAPGNPGVAAFGTCVDIAPNDSDELLEFARKEEIDLTVVGPEDPLANGIVDEFQEAGLAIFGPSAEAARLEASKAFAKKLMSKYQIPTAGYAEFVKPDEAKAYVKAKGTPIVIKADGLAAGKGVAVCHDEHSAIVAIDEIMEDRRFGDAGARVIVEECLEGEEASVFALTDGEAYLTLVPSQDHKPLEDGDRGANTGGMGAYAPAPVVTPELEREIEDSIIGPTIRAMADEGYPYRGVLYAGLMITAEGPKVIEFNCRFGDPETQVVLPLLESDLVPLLLASCEGNLKEHQTEWRDGACVTVVMASGGYPGSYDKGIPITGIDEAEGVDGVRVFHAGTKLTDGRLVTNGGRVLNVTAFGGDIGASIQKAYDAVHKIAFEHAHWRTDIGQKALSRPR